MSKLQLTFFLDELGIVRVYCPASSCKGVIELPVASLPTIKKQAECPVCGGFLRFDNAHLQQLGMAISGLAESGMKIEFVLPAKE